MTDMEDPRNIKDRSDFVETLNGGKSTPTRKALEIIFDNMQHNFERIRESQQRNEAHINDLKLQVGVLNSRMRDVDHLETELNDLKDDYNNFINNIKLSNVRFMRSALGIGGLGAFLIVLQIIQIILGT
ncbi:MAG: hypothetical protein ACTSR2_06360 [Candidatus Hodarchaeales archaeon]